MDDLVGPNSRVPAQHLARAYADLPVGVVITAASGLVILANTVAEEIFSPLQPVDLVFRALLALSGATGGGELARAVETGSSIAPVRIGLPDSRIFDGRCRHLSDGGALITLLDVSAYIGGCGIGRSGCTDWIGHARRLS
jgi:hypothetical protein